MKYWSCPACGKQLLRLEPYYDDEYLYWCDDCNIDIRISDNDGQLKKDYEEMIKNINKKENDNNE